MDDLAFSLTPSGGSKPPLLFRGSASGSSAGVPRAPSLKRPGSRSTLVYADQASGSAEENGTPVARLKAGYVAPSLPAGLDKQTSGESEGSQQKSVEQLEATNARLRARCEQQERTLKAMGKQLSALRSGKADPGEQQPVLVEVEAKPTPATVSPDLVDGCTQTDDDLIERCQIQQEQLDALYEAAGAKSREVHQLQETVWSLQKDLQAHQKLSEQFREQVMELETSLAESTQQRHRAEEERTILEWQLRTAKSVRGGTKKGSAADRSTACPSTPGSQMFTEPPSMQSTLMGLQKHGGQDDHVNDRNKVVAPVVSAAAARGAARMAQWAEKSDDGSGDEASTSQLLETSIGASDDEDF
eukprot:gnl/MRDRNA2_/MRDRNA2_113516_c0_seq1.p1 gnl/MRDRNA2_/MRDRNA2_113516_c0~~gnl/MRDRNA2_/MRDRNA2_113516_c0_seq1.p1  ORF type:complete len:358 (+),score=92.14 gnl/MRDRNA2_/MRDRNA2_113516_c0_seq1:153-1226(+)